MKHLAITMCMILGLAGWALAQEEHYEGEIINVNAKAHTFTVKATEKAEPAEMEFYVGATSQITIEGERKILAELEKGDYVDVAYETSGMTHTVKTVNRQKTAMKEMVFDGQIVNVDDKANTFTVRRMVSGQAEEMTFHLDPMSRVYIGAKQEFVIRQIHKGDEVTVQYETSAGKHLAKAVSKPKKATS